MIQFILILFLFFSLNSCAQPEKKYSTIFVKDTLEINTYNTPPLKLREDLIVKINEDDYLKIDDNYNKVILLYNLKTHNSDTIHVQKLWSQIDAFYKVNCSYIHNLDSIYIATNHNKILLINKNGEVKKSWSYPHFTNEGDGIEIANDTKLYYYHDKNEVYFIQRLISKNPLKEYSNRNIVQASFDNENSRLIKKKSFAPYFNCAYIYRSLLYPSPRFHFNNEDSLFLLIYSKCDSFYVYNMNGNLKASVPINSKYKTPFLTYDFKKAKEDPLYIDKFLIECPLVYLLLWDKYRKLYYVIYRHRINYKEKDGVVNSYIDADFSLLIFDRNFNKLNEVVFKNNYTFSYSNPGILVMKEGLAVGINHEFQPHLKEKKLKYIILDIDKYVN